MFTSTIRSAAVAALFLAGAAKPVAAQTNPANFTYQHMTTIESVVGGGFGRSKMLFTPAYKGTAEAPLENLFSLTGINMSNIQKNEETIQRTLQTMSSDGFELVHTIPLTSSIQNGGIFMTRYIFRKPK